MFYLSCISAVDLTFHSLFYFGSEHYTLQSLYNAVFWVHKNGLYYKGSILQRNYRKMTILWSFPYNFFVKFHS